MLRARILRASSRTLKTECERLDSEFILVPPTLRWLFPWVNTWSSSAAFAAPYSLPCHVFGVQAKRAREGGERHNMVATKTG